VKIEFTPEQLNLQREIRQYMKDIMTPELAQEMRNPEYFEGGGPEFRRLLKKMGSDGWIALSWPKKYGGREASPIEQYIFTDEVMRAGFPYPFLTTESVGPVLAEHGSEEIRKTVVQGILKGEVIIAVGYSEPSAGTDLASLTTKAEKTADGWLINGQKMWTSLANYADYVWLAARTDPDAAKPHKGLSMFLMPVDNPGFSLTPVHTLGVRTNATYYQDVQLPGSALVGELNNGWRMITGQLNRERLSLVNYGPIAALYEDTAQWAAQTLGGDGQPIINQPWVQANLAKVKIGAEALRLICLKQAWAMTGGNLAMADASAAKVYGSEFFVECYRMLLEIMGQAGALHRDSVGAILQGKLEMRYRVGSVLTFGGGANEVQRDIISAAGLWMPRSR
jgi:alkylation response protein AidB-like acyl-CoA dehydrogenase|tara:strand:+ start:346 stop:1527 length:1182 start_codon:yes stop_codon:yes gene_type:complete